MSETERPKNRQSVRLQVSAKVAAMVQGRCSDEDRLRAIRGQSNLTDAEWLTLLICLSGSGSAAVAGEVKRAMETFPLDRLQLLAVDPFLQPGLLAFLAKHMAAKHGLESFLLANPSLPEAFNPFLLTLMKRRKILQAGGAAGDAGAGDPADESEAADEQQDYSGEFDEDEDPENQSKYQMTLHMGVAEKVKAALTGDKEWRKLLINDPNKLVSSAVLKNPRISEGEVYTIARSKSANEELIRIILLNKDWVKNYAIKLALVMHPRTPLNQSLRFMGVLTEKDLGALAKSREISRVIANNARRILMNKNKR